MPYIYKVTNIRNGKAYIGKTLDTVDFRWKQHCKDYKKERCEKRPLYAAMRKYGVECFSVEPLEDCSAESLSSRERFWIEYYGTFKNGYNATRGGDGKSYIDYIIINETYLQTQSEKETAKMLSIDIGTVRRAIKLRGDEPISSQRWSRDNYGLIINMFSLSGEFISTFASAHEAARFVLPNAKYKQLHGASSHISDVCRGKRKKAYGYTWSFGKRDEQDNAESCEKDPAI